jgi:hypothetical protein
LVERVAIVPVLFYDPQPGDPAPQRDSGPAARTEGNTERERN